MKYIVAVSGGVDSMVLLDMMAQDKNHELIVAHFDHGIRSDSHLDAVFVKEAAQRYGLLFETRREELGEHASEELARNQRYAFLRELAKKHNATIATAHHLDDLVETVAINFTRGTGWRGLAALDSDILRPLIDTEKTTLITYARKNGIEWHEDSTNQTDTYLRNRVRSRNVLKEDAKRQVRALHAHQKSLRRAIDEEVEKLVGEGPQYSRYLFTHMPVTAALESLRHVTGARLTRPQLARLLHAIKVAKPGAKFEAGNGVKAYFSTRQFSL